MFRAFFAALICAVFACFGGVSAAVAVSVVDRSEYTTTTQVAPGQLRTTVSPQPLNFQTESGAWKPVDLELDERSDGAASPGAVDGDIVIPAELSDAVEVAHSGREVTFQLKGASGDAEFDDSTATFDSAMPGVDVQYEATARGVKERLVLASASAPAVYAYDVRAGAAWSAAVDERGEVVLRDGGGAERYRITAPLAWDSAADPSFTNALALSVSKVSAGRWTVTLRPDLAWLRDEARVFPVTLDPDFSWSAGTTHFHGAADCYLSGNTQANNTFCAQTYLQTGYFNRPYKSIFKFDIAAAIPANAVVSAATFKAYAPPASARASGNHRLHTITSDWDSTATWNNRKTGVPWTTAGGDISSNSAYSSSSPTAVQALSTWFTFPAPLAAVQGWVNGTLPNYGFLLATDSGAPANQAYAWASTEASMSSSFPATSNEWPTLDVTWSVPDTTAPALTLSGALSTGQTTWRTAATGDITLAGTDAGTGVKRVEVLKGSTVIASDTQTCPAGGCAMNRTFALDLDALGNGIHTLKAAAVDGGNLRTEQTFTVRVDRAVPALALTGTLVDLENEPATTGTRNVHVAATDAGAGIVDLEMKVDGAQKEHVTQSCAPGACSRTEDWSVDVGALGDGTHEVLVTATDGAGRTKAETVEIVKNAYPMPDAPPLSDTSVTPFPEQVDFLYDGPEAVQTGLDPETLDERRTAVVTGKVFNDSGVPAAGVTVSVADHPEFGETVSRENGQFFLVVNGGAQLRLRYEVQGALPAERQVETKWNDYVWADDVWLVSQDPVGTPVDFGAAVTDMQVAESSVVSDEDGERQTRVLIHPGTQAWKQKTDGTMEPLTGGTMRLTEYTVGGEEGEKRMPATLPDSTAYTWAAEFQIDEAQGAGVEHVRFSKPVVAYVENFLDFPVGLDVPIGTYEPSKGAWAGDPDGRVIKILSESGGKAVVDVTGFGAANEGELDYFNIDDEELEELADAYEPGDTLWRTRLIRFSSVDWNHAFFFPPWWLDDFGDDPFGDPDDCCEQPGSIIGVQNQSLGETADLGGTPYSLRYDSARTPGAAGSRSIRVPLTDEEPDEDLAEVRAVAVIAGQRLIHTLKPEEEGDPIPADAAHTFRWDGNDAFGRPMVGGAMADIEVRNIFPAEYSPVERASRPRASSQQLLLIEMPFFSGGSNVSWGSGGSGSVWDFVSMPPTPDEPQPVDRPTLECDATETNCWSDVPTPRELGESRVGTPVARAYSVAVPYMDARSMGVGGWGVSVQHRYDTGTGTLYTGDGQRRSADTLVDRVETTRRMVVPNANGDLIAPVTTSMDVLPDGSSVRAAPWIGSVIVDDPQGHSTILAGQRGAAPGSGDGGPATEAGFAWPYQLAAAPDGTVYVSDVDDRRVRRISPDGTISTAVGNGTATDGADSTDPLQHAIYPQELAVAGDGTLYIAGGDGIHVLSPDGRMSILAAVSGCGAESNRCRYYTQPPRKITAGQDGTVYWTATNGDHVVRLYRYTPGGGAPQLLSTAYGFDQSKEGPIGLANIAPAGLEIDDAGRLLLLESGYDKIGIWRLGADGRVRKIGLSCFDTNTPDQIIPGEGGPLKDACGWTTDIDQGPDGLYLHEYGSWQVRRASSALQRYPVDDTLIASEDGGEVYRFDKEGRHLETLDGRTERVIRTFAYDSEGRLSGITETDLGTTTFAYGAGSVTATGPDGQQTLIEINGDGWATRIQDAAGEGQEYEYSATGLMDTYTDQLGNDTVFTWGPTGRLLTDTSPEGGTQTLARNEAGSQTTVTHQTAGGQTTTYRTEKQAAPKTGDDEEDEDAVRREVQTVTAADGSKSTVSETSEGADATALVSADGTVVEQERSSDPRWGAQVSTYASKAKLPSGLEASGSHDTHVQRSSTQDSTDPFAYESIIDTYTVGGRTTTSTYDKGERTDTAESPMGRTSQVEYDDDDRPVRISAPAREDVEVEYDSRGRPTSVSQGDAESTATYGADGRVASTTDAEGGVTTVGRDAVGRPTTVTGPDGEDTGFTYDAAGQLSSVTAPDGRAFSFEYDDNGNQTQMTRPARAGSGDTALVSTREYDAQDRLTSRTRPSGEEVTTSYDSAGRLAEREADDGTSAGAAYEPVADGKGGRLTSTQTGEGASTELEYDGSLLTGVQSLGDTWSGDATADQPEVEFGYDESLRLTSEEIDGDSVGYGYNNDDQATQVGDVSLSYDEDSGDPETVSAGVASTQIGVDARGDLQSLASTTEASGVAAPVLSESVVRDDLGRITQRTETVGSGPADVYGYSYDLAGRLTQVTKNAAVTETYGYDSTGGLTSRGNGVVSTWIHTDGHGRPTQTADGTQLEWSPDGELLKLTAPGGAETEFGYDGFGRLVEVISPDGEIGRYRYDASGRRTAVRLDGSLVRRFVYGGAEFPRARVDADGDVLERYVYASYEHVPDLIVRRDGQRLRLITDAVGSVRAVVDADTGAVVQRLAYDAYGRTTQNTAPGTQPFGFKGALADPVAQGAGLVWMGVRAYLPLIGRFTTTDPAGLAAVWNQHDALGGDPINLIDADGRFAVLAVLAAPLAASAATLATAAVEVAAAATVGWGLSKALDAARGLGGSASMLAPFCVNGIHNAINNAQDAVDGDEDGDAAESIANGHAAGHLGDFEDLGIMTPEELEDFLRDVMGSGATIEKELENGRTGYYDPGTGTIIVVDPRNADGGSVFRPRDAEDYWDNKLK